MSFHPFLLATGFLVAALAGFTQWKSARIEAAFPPQGAFVAVDGGRLHLTQRAPVGATRNTVLLLHGASGNQADMMLPLGDRLAAKGFRVIAVDRPGQGWSERPGGRADASPARQAQLIRAAMAKIGVDHAIVVGHSLAGALAVNFALDQADFTSGLVLIAPVTHPWPGGIAWYYHVAATPLAGDVFTHLLTMPIGLASLPGGIANVFAPQAPPPDFASSTGVNMVLRPAAFRANAQDVAAIKEFVTAQSPRMPQIHVPTGIITGDSDGVVLTRIHSYGSARDIPGATLTVLPGIGHSPHHSDPDAVVRMIEDVADRIAAQPGQAAKVN